MNSSSILTKLGKKLQKLASINRKSNSLTRSTWNDVRTSVLADKGHFVVYTIDQNRFVIPLVYLNSGILRALLELSKDEFGLPGDGPITLPCEAFFMEYIIMLIQRGVDKNLEEPLLMSIATCCALSYSLPYEEPTILQFRVSTECHRISSNHELLGHSFPTSCQGLRHISAKKLIKLVRKWQKLAPLSRKRITMPTALGKVADADGCSTSTIKKGHFAVYSNDTLCTSIGMS
ncbi:unnamed protein product [Dovyalis caffra]|uniref:Uncharacterized protein n=1 Tax=Dovyalis caffra TaxID=77055 RepID=A0AAV1S5Y6_9ROSI|nr:unnamed protein product [Dovyalis caffra]